MSTELTVEEVRRQLLEAMDLPGDIDWLSEACRQIEAYRALLDRRKRYDVSTVAMRIRTAREIVGLTRCQLAHRIGYHHWSYVHVEEGRQNLPLVMVPRLARILAVSEAWLMMESDEGGPPTPGGILRKQVRVNWRKAKHHARKKAEAKAELERVRGLRPPKPDRSKPKEGVG